MYQLLRLTEEEKKWNWYYTRGNKRGVELRRYSYISTITSSNSVAVAPHKTSRRARIWSITWTGDVNALRVNIYTSAGERYTVEPLHIPLLSGHSPHSTLSRSALFGGSGAFTTNGGAAGTAGSAGQNLWPSATNVASNSPFAMQAPPAWQLIFEPNIIVPAGSQLNLEYSLEEPLDPFTNVSQYQVEQVVHAFEFPGFQRGPA